jgi:hypothetical protein
MRRHLCAALVMAALAGCSSGGGGSSGPSAPPAPPPPGDSSNPPQSSPPEGGPPASSPPAAFEYRTLATVEGAIRAESAIPAGQGFESLRGRVFASADGTGNFTFRVDDPGSGPYQFTVKLPPNTTLNISQAHVSGTFASFDYSALGTWQNPRNSFFYAGSAVTGMATRAADLPRTGTASYSGPFLGRYLLDGEPYSVSASARSLANFGTGAVSFETTGSQIAPEGGSSGIPDPWPQLDLVGSMTFLSSEGARRNALRGPVRTKHDGVGSMSGELRAFFFGPSSATSAPPELGGSVAATNGNDHALTGAFTMRR